MTKRKMKKWKKILVISVVSLLLLVITPISVFWFYPYPRHIAWNKTPIESEEYFDYPDQILIYYGGKTRILRRDKDISACYDAFWALLGNQIIVRKGILSFKTKGIDKNITELRKLSDGGICVEFRYQQRRSYYKEWEDRKMEYDAAMVIIPTPSNIRWRGDILSCCSLNATYTFSDMGTYIKVGGELNDFVNYVEGLF